VAGTVAARKLAVAVAVAGWELGACHHHGPAVAPWPWSLAPTP